MAPKKHLGNLSRNFMRVEPKRRTAWREALRVEKGWQKNTDEPHGRPAPTISLPRLKFLSTPYEGEKLKGDQPLKLTAKRKSDSEPNAPERAEV